MHPTQTIRPTLWLATLLLLLPMSPVATAEPTESTDPNDSHAQAAIDLFDVMHMQETMSRAIDKMLDVQARANPALAPYRDTMRTFLLKYMGWDSLEPEMVEVYRAEFTETELVEIADFYGTPLGQKVIRLLPSLAAKGAAIGQARVQSNMAELQELLAADEAQRNAPAETLDTDAGADADDAELIDE